MTDPQKGVVDAPKRLRMALARLGRRVRLMRAMAASAAVACVALLGVSLGARILDQPLTWQVWAGICGMVMVTGLAVGFGIHPPALALARTLDLKLQAHSPAEHADLVVCAVGLMTANPGMNNAFATLSCAHAVRALDLLPQRNLWPAWPRGLCGALGLAGLLGVVLAPGSIVVDGDNRNAETRAATLAAHIVAMPSPAATRSIKAQRAAQWADAATESLVTAFANHMLTQGLATGLAQRDAERVQTEIAALKQELRRAPVQTQPQIAAALNDATANLPTAVAASFGNTANNNAGAAEGEGEGQPADPALKRLQKQLDHATTHCERDPQACAEQLSQLEPQLEQLAREDARQTAESLRNEAQAADVAPQELHAAPSAAEQRQGSEGENPTPGSDNKPGDPTGAAAPLPGPVAGASTQSTAPPAAPVPAVAGGEAQAVDVPLPFAANGRAELVSTTAELGFSPQEYRATYGAYRTVVEAALDRAAVPAPRRETVRRYFHHIRPTTRPQTP